ncbi:MAG: hypothetical protein DRP60_13225 [Spirochaetes bacterium]|nr:MAG: hypothetical protein DRP60_13225 [Spirochaetota bacterium]
MAGLDYLQLYRLQDEVLSAVFAVEREFYLTGGTCLSRFYKEKRYSDDLDFFAQNSPRFSFAIRNIRNAFQKTFSLTVEVETINFVRYRLNNLLQVDFVNDISARYGDVIITDKNYIIDTAENILSNKLTAVLGRDNPKDIFDIYLICTFYSFSWEDIIASAHEKAGFSNEDLVIRLKSFPQKMLGIINYVDEKFLLNFEKDFPVIINEIIEESDHIPIKKD